MSNEKKYNEREAAVAVLKKAEEMLKSSTLAKKHQHIGWDKLHSKIEGEGYSKESADKIAGAIKAKVHPAHKSEEMSKAQVPWSKPEKDADQHAEGKGPKGEIHPKEKEEAPSDEVRDQKDPQHNPKEEAEGNNELAGTTPTQVGEDGKNVPGYDEMKGHLKLAKFIGWKEHKRSAKKLV
jgi:hypothetical protein